MPPHPIASDRVLDDAELVCALAQRDTSAFEVVMRRHNSALFRVARSILKDDADAEDALQDAYLAAYRHLSDFQGNAKLSTWLTRIVINEALARLRRRRRDNVVSLFDGERDAEQNAEEQAVDEPSPESPEHAAMRAQMRRILERKIDGLPLIFRMAFVLREVEEMTVDETAASLSITAATVRTRVFRARALLRASLAEEMDVATSEVFGFAGARCDRVVAAVLQRLRELSCASQADRPAESP